MPSRLHEENSVARTMKYGFSWFIFRVMLVSVAPSLTCGCSDAPSQSTAQEDVPNAPPASPALPSIASDHSTLPKAKGPCFLGAPTLCLLDGKFEVIIDGKLVATFGDRRAGEPVNARRVVFQGAGQVTITFRIYRQKTLAYQPTFTTVVEPGTLLATNWQFADEKPTPDFGPGPDHSFPALTTDVPKSVWCWFGPAPIHKDLARVSLDNGAMVPGVRKLLAQADYVILQENRRNAGKTLSWKLQIPQDKTIVEAILELEGMKGVTSVSAEVTHVY